MKYICYCLHIKHQKKQHKNDKKIFLWVFAVFMALAAMIYQRSTGPTYEYKGYLEHAGEKYNYELLRSQETTEGAKIQIPYFEGANYTASLHYKRYQTKYSVTSVDFTDNKMLIM